jgi:hypothetical protein
MDILGTFLMCDVRCNQSSLFGRWAVDDSLGMNTGGNVTFLEKRGEYVFLTDQLSEEETPTELKMTRKQFVEVFDYWLKVICKTKPKEVIIKYENDQFTFETKD